MAKMNRYYRLTRVESDRFGVAYTPEDIGFELVDEHVRGDKWNPVSFTLKDGGFSDYQINDNNWPMCSKKLKTLLETGASAEDSLEWLSVNVVDQSGTSEEYFVLHFPERPDVLDQKRTLFAGDFVVKPVFSRTLIGPHRVFIYPSGESVVIIAEPVKDAITQANCVGLDFIEVPISG
jgi:hypothetical protein